MPNTRGYLYGFFDLFNVGDLAVIEQARQFCDHLTVGVVTDSLVADMNYRPLVIPFSERAEIVGNIRGVDAVVPHQAVALATVQAQRDLDVIFADPRLEPEFAVNATDLVSVQVLDTRPGTGSSILRSALQRRNSADASVA
jgi:glycerol-3-phosphate cytidylyltransferase